MRRNVTEYHKSISDELKATQSRVRNLIGDAHWLTDGEHKEAVLRKVLKSHLPESVRVGTGFICHPNDAQNYQSETSSQLDILITSVNKPTLFKDGDLTIVTPDAVEAIIEVKTKLSAAELRSTLNGLADQAEKIRDNAFDKPPVGKFAPGRSKSCWAGLFIFDSRLEHRTLMKAVCGAARGKEKRAINCIAAGQDRFVRYWPITPYEDGNVYQERWHTYEMTNLAIGYFVSNLVWHISDDIPNHTEQIWFPIEEGKESLKKWYATLGGDIRQFR